MSKFFEQLLNDGQADLAIASLALAPYRKAVSAAAHTKAYREAGLPETEEQVWEFDARFMETIRPLYEKHKAEVDADKAKIIEHYKPVEGQPDWYHIPGTSNKVLCGPCDWSQFTLERYYRSLYNRSASGYAWEVYASVVMQARKEVDEQVRANALKVAGLTIEQVKAYEHMESEAKKKITNAKNNLAGRGLADRQRAIAIRGRAGRY